MTINTLQQHQSARSLVVEMSNKPSTINIMKAVSYRDDVWKRAGINLTKSIDLYRTTKKTAELCVRTLQNEIKNHETFTYIEPSAGTGAFLDFLPTSTLAMDILPQQHSQVKRQEFLTWLPAKDKGQKYIVIGAPPLGVYSDVSVAFVNHALEFADVVGMIVRRHIGERQIKNGKLLKVLPLERGSVLDMTSGFVKYDMEFRVWKKC